MHSNRNKWAIGAIAGLVAGIVLATWEMAVEGFRSVSLSGSFWGSVSTHTGFWAAPQYIGATVLRSVTNGPSFQTSPASV